MKDDGEILVVCEECGHVNHVVPSAHPTHDDGFNALDALDCVAQRTAKWKMINEQTARCSACGEVRHTNGYDQTMKGHIFYAMYKFCPNCGARMEGEDK